MIYRKCECTVYPLDPLAPYGRCKNCGVRPEAMPDYDDYVKLAEDRARLRKENRELLAKLQERSS